MQEKVYAMGTAHAPKLAPRRSSTKGETRRQIKVRDEGYEVTQGISHIGKDNQAQQQVQAVMKGSRKNANQSKAHHFTQKTRLFIGVRSNRSESCDDRHNSCDGSPLPRALYRQDNADRNL